MHSPVEFEQLLYAAKDEDIPTNKNVKSESVV
jgi:hypothetical protein